MILDGSQMIVHVE